MSVLSGHLIREYVKSGRLVVEPFDPLAVGPASLDIALGNEMHTAASDGRSAFVNTLTGEGYMTVQMSLAASGGWSLYPGRLYLAATRERVEVPTDLIAYLHGRSTLARFGVIPHQEAGLIDPGFRGFVTLELSVLLPTVLFPGQPIGQLTFQRVACPVEGYAGRYQDAAGVGAPVPFGEAVS